MNYNTIIRLISTLSLRNVYSFVSIPRTPKGISNNIKKIRFQLIALKRVYGFKKI